MDWRQEDDGDDDPEAVAVTKCLRKELWPGRRLWKERPLVHVDENGMRCYETDIQSHGRETLTNVNFSVSHGQRLQSLQLRCEDVNQ